MAQWCLVDSFTQTLTILVPFYLVWTTTKQSEEKELLLHDSIKCERNISKKIVECNMEFGSETIMSSVWTLIQSRILTVEKTFHRSVEELIYFFYFIKFHEILFHMVMNGVMKITHTQDNLEPQKVIQMQQNLVELGVPSSLFFCCV